MGGPPRGETDAGGHGATRRALLGGAVLLAAVAGASAQDRFHAAIDVVLTTVEVRAVTPRGDAIADLGPDDFRVTFGGASLPVVAADWIAAGASPTEAVAAGEAAATDPARTPAPAGRLVVVFVQADFAPSRLAGHLRMSTHVERFLATQLAPGDRVAVVSHDSRLRLRSDFTRDRPTLAAALREAIKIGGAEGPPRHEPPSLGIRLQPAAARDAASAERALELAAAALGEERGEKALVYVGWGLGRFGRGGVRLGEDYERARQALARAGVPVFVLDVSTADYHSLEVGLQAVAADSSGSYARTHLFPQQAMRRLAGSLAGHYVLSLDRPARLPARGRLRVELVGRRGTVTVIGG